MKNTELDKKIAGSIKLLQSVQKAHEGEEIELAYSGGKDSDVILQLAKEAGINYRAIYKNTTIDPPGTIAHVKENGVEIRQPQKTFFQLITEKDMMPNRWARFCCAYLKEYKILDTCIMGVRRAESVKRAARYSEPTECRYYGSKKNHVEAVYPILEWTNDDVRDFIIDRNIKLAPVYYGENGELHIERRLGCVGCPLASHKHRLRELQKYPNMVKAYIRALQANKEIKKNNAVWTKHTDPYDYLVHDLFYPSIGYKNYKYTIHRNLFGDIDSKQLLEQYFKIKL